MQSDNRTTESGPRRGRDGRTADVDGCERARSILGLARLASSGALIFRGRFAAEADREQQLATLFSMVEDARRTFPGLREMSREQALAVHASMAEEACAQDPGLREAARAAALAMKSEMACSTSDRWSAGTIANRSSISSGVGSLPAITNGIRKSIAVTSAPLRMVISIIAAFGSMVRKLVGGGRHNLSESSARDNREGGR